MSNIIRVIKVGGNELDTPAFLDGLCSTLAESSHQTVLVHGGGKEISAALELYGQPVQFIDGIRVTPPESMAVMEMVVCGRINKRIVAHLVNAGRRALGLSGVDLGLMRCEPYCPQGVDLGRVGSITTVNVAMIQTMLLHGWLPVLAPVALGHHDGLPYNINADHAALGVAVALASRQTDTGPTELVFVSNVPGVLVDGQVREHLDKEQTEALIATGAIHGGMIPKVRSALHALAGGVTSVRITNLDGLLDGGTRIGKSL
jgi:acetylglutamate kinase